ncbi:MAG: hypothetical protein ACYC3X_22000 [Pirellulaceae bacterium]
MMKTSRTFVWVTTILFAAVVAAFSYAGEEIEWSDVAAISNIDEIAHIHITNLLASKGIDCRIDGSVIDTITVPTLSVVEKARAILRQDVREGGYYMIFPNGGASETTRRSAKRSTFADRYDVGQA